jgi:23S rRNA G2445 N2-methylase RlmL
MRCDEIRLTGSGGANRVMEAEMKRLVMRSEFEIRVPKPRREGETALLYPFDPRIAWVAACHHRTSSRISWDLFSSDAIRLEPLFAELLPALTADERLPSKKPHLRFSVELGSVRDFEAGPLQLRGVVKNALVEALAARGVTAEIDADAPEVVFVVRRAGTPDCRRTVVGIDLGLGPRHRRGDRVASGPAPLRETLAAQLIMLSRWDARTEPLVDPMAGGATIPIEAAGLAVGAPIRYPADLPFRYFEAFEGLPGSTHDLFPGTVPYILALDIDEERIGTMVGNLRAAQLTGKKYEHAIVIGQKDMRSLTPEYIVEKLPASADMKPGVFCFNPPYGVRIGGERGERNLLDLYASMGRAMSRFPGWRAACFVANPGFVEAFGHTPAMKKPASNAELPGAFLVYNL